MLRSRRPHCVSSTARARLFLKPMWQAIPMRLRIVLHLITSTRSPRAGGRAIIGMARAWLGTPRLPGRAHGNASCGRRAIGPQRQNRPQGRSRHGRPSAHGLVPACARDPEASYRRGYTHGAEEVFRAVAPALPEDVSAKIKRWLKGDLAA